MSFLPNFNFGFLDNIASLDLIRFLRMSQLIKGFFSVSFSRFLSHKGCPIIFQSNYTTALLSICIELFLDTLYCNGFLSFIFLFSRTLNENSMLECGTSWNKIPMFWLDLQRQMIKLMFLKSSLFGDNIPLTSKH